MTRLNVVPRAILAPLRPWVAVCDPWRPPAQHCTFSRSLEVEPRRGGVLGGRAETARDGERRSIIPHLPIWDRGVNVTGSRLNLAGEKTTFKLSERYALEA